MFGRWRRCRICHKRQQHTTHTNWMRVTGYSWYPNVGRCPGKSAFGLSWKRDGYGSQRLVDEKGHVYATVARMENCGWWYVYEEGEDYPMGRRFPLMCEAKEFIRDLVEFELTEKGAETHVRDSRGNDNPADDPKSPS